MLSSDAAAKRASVIKAMISSLRNGEDRHYYVGLTGCYIDGISYSASGLSVDPTATPDIEQTDAGFMCTAMFPPDMLSPGTAKAGSTIKTDVGGKIVEVV